MYIAEHIMNLAQSFDSKISGAENLLVQQLGRYFFYPRDKQSLVNTHVNQAQW